MSKLAGTRVVVYEVYEDGREVQSRNTFTKLRRPVDSLDDLWVKGSALTLDTFLERAKNGEGLVNDGNEWTGGSLSINETYIFLAYDVGCLKKNQRIETIYRAFKGTFTIPKVNTPRALRDRKSTETKTYRDRQKKFRDYLYNLFYDFCSVSGSGTKPPVYSNKF